LIEIVSITRTKNDAEWRTALDAGRAEIKARLGIEPGFLWQGHDYACREGTLYKRDVNEGDLFTAVDDRTQPDAPDVMCPCGSVAFALRYGNYEIRARCVECGTEAVVYDG
jgi:hypothetical protein